MEYLNIPVAVFRSPEFIGADPVQRGTWAALMGWCAHQENGGRIAGCRAWKDRMWQQLVGVTAEEVLADSTLWEWDGDDLVLCHYPLAQQVAKQTKHGGNVLGGSSTSEAKQVAARENGKKGGRPKVPSPLLAGENPSQTQVKPNEKEGKGKESKGREEAREGAPAAAPLSPSQLSRTDRIIFQLAAVFPSETGPLDRDDKVAMAENLDALEALDEDDWLASRCWVSCPARIRDTKGDLWPRDRSEFIRNSAKAMAKIRPWWKRAGRKWFAGQQVREPPKLEALPDVPTQEEIDREFADLRKRLA